ncbi:hypothetical protein CHS0354_027436 [Potamilus streckersoni]|uniref:Uncharacterized protein n=1 Tax=Potamilus streckersoni TaxID=2493646 RepID=A0AAE0VPE4_9BIVA|nr:hypothetical protein CHS0354_027436 [Potamilus streckersoni]
MPQGEARRTTLLISNNNERNNIIGPRRMRGNGGKTQIPPWERPANTRYTDIPCYPSRYAGQQHLHHNNSSRHSGANEGITYDYMHDQIDEVGLGDLLKFPEIGGKHQIALVRSLEVALYPTHK